MIIVGAIRRGQRYGNWVITGDRRLGSGANGEVWRAKNSDGRTGAIKILNPPRRENEGKYRLSRFKDEVSFLIAYPAFPGISIITVQAADRSAARSGRRLRSAQASGRVTQPLSGRLWPTLCGDSENIALQAAAQSRLAKD